MSAKNYVWNGPPTAIEILSEDGAQTSLFSGQVTPGEKIPVQIEETHSLVLSWLASKTIEETDQDDLRLSHEEEAVHG